ncbi:MAG: beta-galactosidase, partial [Planctomycetota bacterium]
PTTSNHHVFDLAPTVTPAPGVYDASYLDLTIRTALDAHPQALLLPRVYVGSSPWWDRMHPDEIGLADDADGGTSPLRMTFVDTRLSKPSPSFASPVWRASAMRDLRQHLEHMAHAPYANRLIGFLVTGGSSEEWFHWYDEEQETLWGDVGPRHQQAFARWLLERYGSTAAVERAWLRPLGDRPIPERTRREHSRFRLLRDPTHEQDVIDFYRFHSEVLADFLLEAARVVKDVSHGRWLAGVFYGYLLHFTGACRHLNGGHLALRRVLDAGVLDFLCAPTGYGHREPVDGFSAFMVPAGSVRLRGKLFYDENDLRTHLAPAANGYMSREYCRREWGVTDNLAESIATQRRELGHVIDKACPLWWFDLYPRGLYHEPQLRAEIAREVEIARTAFALDRTSAAEIAVLVDEESCLFERPEGSLFWHCVSLAREPLARMGAPYQVYLLEDLPELPPHTLYVFLNAWAPSERVRAEVRRLAVANKHRVFFGPAGIYRRGALDWDAPFDLIGMPVEVRHEQGELTATVADGGRLAPFCGLSFGPGAFPPPYVVPRAADGIVIEARSPQGEPLIASQDRAGACTWFCATPCPPHQVLTAIARACGVHVFLSSGDPIHASRTMLSIHARSSGQKSLDLRAPSALTDAVTGELAAPRAQHHDLTMQAGETRLYFLGEPHAWQAARERAQREARRS